jgi:hypothetical protein
MQDPNLLNDIGLSLASLAIKGTFSSINTKIKAMKNESNIERVRNSYDEIINELLSEREEAIRIAQTYKNEIERIEISDANIQHLNKTITRVLSIFKELSPDTPIETYEQLQSLINVDTLKAMQLLGFNYKAAIGEPLTELCANAILSKGKLQNKTNEQPTKDEKQFTKSSDQSKRNKR